MGLNPIIKNTLDAWCRFARSWVTAKVWRASLSLDLTKPLAVSYGLLIPHCSERVIENGSALLEQGSSFCNLELQALSGFDSPHHCSFIPFCLEPTCYSNTRCLRSFGDLHVNDILQKLLLQYLFCCSTLTLSAQHFNK